METIVFSILQPLVRVFQSSLTFIVVTKRFVCYNVGWNNLKYYNLIYKIINTYLLQSPKASGVSLTVIF